tara:strand:+ start:223 stop:435 length:213 start_codon:yes stop_codon:yes gene_type:complete
MSKNKKSYMNTKGIINEGFFQNLMKLLLKGRISKAISMFDDNPQLEKATKDVNKALDDYRKILKKQGYRY